jgi:Ni/Co efflux regulator RcnB
MKHLMSAALALALISGSSALAQPPEHERGAPRGGEHPEGGARPGPQGAPHANAEAPAPRPPGGPQGGAREGGPREGGYTGGPRGGATGHQGPTGAAPNAQHTPAGGAYRGESRVGHPAAQGGPTANRGAPNANGRGSQAPVGHAVPQNYHPRYGVPGARPGGDRPRYDAQYYPRSFQPSRRFAWRGAVWRPQPGYYYRRWGYGERLPFGWFDRRWYIDDYYYYDLPVPPYGYEWIRVGPDALLIDLDDGEVVESVYGLFY